MDGIKASKRIKDLKQLSKNTKERYEENFGKNKKESIDKYTFCFSESGHHHNQHFSIFMHHSSGSYGSSNVSDVFDDSALLFITQACTEMKEKIIYRACELMEIEAKNNKQALQEEIKELSEQLKTV